MTNENLVSILHWPCSPCKKILQLQHNYSYIINVNFYEKGHIFAELLGAQLVMKTIFQAFQHTYTLSLAENLGT